MSERIRPFVEDSEYGEWKRRNCQRCSVGWRPGQQYQCDLEAALDYAYLDCRTVTEEIAQHLKFDGRRIAEDCPARVLTVRAVRDLEDVGRWE